MNLLERGALPDGYGRLLATLHRHLFGSEPTRITATGLGQLLRERGISTLLEIGTGGGEFLRTLAPQLRSYGVQPYAVDIILDPYAQMLLTEIGVQVLQADASSSRLQFATQKFDLILAVGVVSLGEALVAQCFGTALMLDRVAATAELHLQLVRANLARLSTHPDAALLLGSVMSFLLLKRTEVAKHARILAWDIDQKKKRQAWFSSKRERYSAAFGMSAVERRTYAELWHSGADVAVLAR